MTSSPTLSEQEATSTILDIAQQLLRELQPSATSNPVRLDSALEHDLGLDSLARVELVHRIEDRFKLALPEQTIASAETPRDLLRAVLTSPGMQAHTTASTSVTLITPAPKHTMAVPDQANTLVEVLQWHLEQHPQQTLIQQYADDQQGETLSYADLWHGARAVASGLQQRGVQAGQTVALMLQADKDYFFSFFGIMLAGAIPVPIYPPARPSQLEDHVRRHGRILQNSLAQLLLTMPEAKAVAALLKAQVDSLQDVLTVDEVMADAATLAIPSIKADDIAFLQYTSGSTGDPKGVVLSHANLLANIRTMGERVQASANDVFVSWLPLYHDMGLIGAWFGSLYYGMLLVVMSPVAFLSRPQRWLWAIHHYRGTISASPNFGYEFCVRRLKPKELEGLDLSSWRIAFNGAEGVSPATVQHFCDRFENYRFQRKHFMPVYGLAENSVGLAFPPLNRGTRVDKIKREPFQSNGVAQPAEPGDTDAMRFVSCGTPIPKHEIRIVDASNREVPERHEGHVQFRGPSSTRGYFRNPVATQKLFSGDWLNSGDLGYLADGELFVTGRLKDVIIRAGRNLYPEELEQAVGDLEHVRKGRVAVFPSKNPKNGTERLIVMAETHEQDPELHQDLRARINALAVDLIGTTTDDVVVAPPGTILKTSSGKLRRAACRELYERGHIGKKPRSVTWQVLRLALAGVRPQWRRLHRAVSTTAYGLYVRACFWLIAPVVWLLVALLPGMAQRWSIMRAGTRLLAQLGATPISIRGLENLLPSQQPVMYVANHCSYLDGPLLVMALGRPFSFIAKAELLDSFVSRIFLQRIGTEFVERFDVEKSVDDMQRISKLAQGQRSLVIFPEGTFTRIPGLRPFRMGAFLIAANNRMPVIPISIRGTRSILRADNWLPHHGAISVTIGKAITPDAIDTAPDKPWDVALRLRDQARTSLLRDTGEPDLAAD